MGFFPVVAFLLVVAASYFFTGRMRRYALAKQVLDVPNQRSSHSVPTPRGGGVAVVVSCALAWLVTALFMTLRMADIWVLVAFAATLAVAAVGWIDDRKGVSASGRLAVHAGATAIGLFSLWRSGHLPAGRVLLEWLPLHWGLGSYFLGVVFLFLFAVWMTNLYNFMDGIDGIIGVQTLTVSSAMALLVILRGDSFLAIQNFLLTAAVIGFLFWNWQPARIFMGDVGSGFLGLLLAVLGLLAWGRGLLPLTAVLILHASFLVDATFTLMVRLARGCRPHQAHRTHCYQKLTQMGWPHATVSTAYGIVNWLWLFPLAALQAMGFLRAWPALGCAFVPMLLLCVWTRAGQEGTRTPSSSGRVGAGSLNSVSEGVK